MFNILLDSLPNEFEGYLIRTDFRIGIQIALCSTDTELSEHEKVITILQLLYGNGMPRDLTTALRGVEWFMASGNLNTDQPSRNADNSQSSSFDFDYDAGRIFSAFFRVYGLDISKERMHWFQFKEMLGDLEGSAFCSVIGYRTADTSKMQGEQKAAYTEMKRRFALPKTYTPEEQQAIDTFMQRLNQTTD